MNTDSNEKKNGSMTTKKVLEFIFKIFSLLLENPLDFFLSVVIYSHLIFAVIFLYNKRIRFLKSQKRLSHGGRGGGSVCIFRSCECGCIVRSE